MGEALDDTANASNEELYARVIQIERLILRMMGDTAKPERRPEDNVLPAQLPFGPSSTRLGTGTQAAERAEAAPSGFPLGRAKFVRRLIRHRRRREHHFPADIFADPAWDMMLDLYAAHYERREISVSSLCIAAAVPATTALRWIKLMVDEGRFVRIADPDDGRRIIVRLSDEARLQLDEYFDDFDD